MLGIPTKIDAHLCIANSHNNHGQQIGQNEEDDIVPAKQSLDISSTEIFL